jgi:hypothetical protein
MMNGAFREKGQADSLINVGCSAAISPMRIHEAFPVDGNVHLAEEPVEQRNSQQFSLAHGVKIDGYAYINKHDIEVGRMIGTKNIGSGWIEDRSVDPVENPHRPDDEMSPYLLDSEHKRKLLLLLQQDKKQREKKEKSEAGIEKEDRTPDPLNREKDIFCDRMQLGLIWIAKIRKYEG